MPPPLLQMPVCIGTSPEELAHLIGSLGQRPVLIGARTRPHCGAGLQGGVPWAQSRPDPNSHNHAAGVGHAAEVDCDAGADRDAGVDRDGGHAGSVGGEPPCVAPSRPGLAGLSAGGLLAEDLSGEGLSGEGVSVKGVSVDGVSVEAPPSEDASSCSGTF